MVESRANVRRAVAKVRDAWRAVEEKTARWNARQADIAAQLARHARGEWGPEHMAALDRMLGDDTESLEVRWRLGVGASTAFEGQAPKNWGRFLGFDSHLSPIFSAEKFCSRWVLVAAFGVFGPEKRFVARGSVLPLAAFPGFSRWVRPIPYD